MLPICHKKTHFFSTKDAGVQSNVDREGAEEKTAKSTRRGIKATVALGQIFFSGVRVITRA